MSSTRVSTRSSNAVGVRTRAVRTEFALPSAGPRAAAPLARPRRRSAPGRSSAAAACVQVVAQRPSVPVSALLRLKVAAVAAIAVLGVGVSAASFASWSQPDPSVDAGVGDPAWAHVTGR